MGLLPSTSTSLSFRSSIAHVCCLFFTLQAGRVPPALPAPQFVAILVVRGGVILLLQPPRFFEGKEVVGCCRGMTAESHLTTVSWGEWPLGNAIE